MALVRPTDQWTAKPRSPQLNSTPQHHRPRTRTTGDTAPKTTHARHRKPTTQQNQPPINSTHERSRLGVLDKHGNPRGGFASHLEAGMFAIGYGIPPRGPLRAIRIAATPLARQIAAYLTKTSRTTQDS